MVFSSPCLHKSDMARGVTSGKGDAEMSQQCHKHFLQYSTFESERPQVRTWGTPNFVPRAPSNLVTPLGMVPSVACECGAELAVDYVVPQCPIHQTPPWTTRPDGSGWWDIDWLLTPVTRSCATRQWIEKTYSNDEEVDPTCRPVAQSAQNFWRTKHVWF